MIFHPAIVPAINIQTVQMHIFISLWCSFSTETKAQSQIQARIDFIAETQDVCCLDLHSVSPGGEQQMFK